MLIAGADVDSTSALIGVFTFCVNGSSSLAWWSAGSAFLLLAGASSDNISSLGGAFMFDAADSPSGAWWSNGSASF